MHVQYVLDVLEHVTNSFFCFRFYQILAKLGGHIATSASSCTHFISNNFVRTRNMLVSMASGKVVATPQWLESCSQAHYFVDEKNYILQDEKKERELGFSMLSSLAAARRKPLLKVSKMFDGENLLVHNVDIRLSES
jgi:hypothetical protein